MKSKILDKLPLPLIIGLLFLSNLLYLLSVFREATQIHFFSVLRGTFASLTILSYPFYVASFTALLSQLGKDRKYKITVIFVILLGVLVIIANTGLYALEVAHYPNYVFSRVGVYLPALMGYSNFQVIMLLSGVLFYFARKKNTPELLSKPIVVLGVVIILISYQIFIDLPKSLLKEYYFYGKKFFVSTNEVKKLSDLGKFSDKMDFIIGNTEPDSVIIHPTQSNEFATVGNQPLIRYVLYPRTLVSDSRKDEFFLKYGDTKMNLYSIIAPSEWGDLQFYPKDNIEAEDLKILFDNGHVSTYTNLKYTEEFAKKEYPFLIGIIRWSR